MSAGRYLILPLAELRRAVALAGRNSLRFTCREALSPIGRNGSIDDGTTVDALPGVKNEKEI